MQRPHLPPSRSHQNCDDIPSTKVPCWSLHSDCYVIQYSASSSLITGTKNYAVVSLDCTDYEETRNFTSLHRMVLGISHKDLDSGLADSLVNLDAVDASGQTPLARAVVRDDFVTVSKLLSSGANPNVRDNSGVPRCITSRVLKYAKYFWNTEQISTTRIASTTVGLCITFANESTALILSL